MIDLRSDTITKPSAAMRAAMAAAEVGDDVYAEDPTILLLENETARTLEKEAALFVTSGTQGNLVSALAHCGRGDELIAGDEAHIVYNELCGVSALGGIAIRTVANRRGALDPDDVIGAIRGPDIHFPRTRLICYENTHNRGGGRALRREQMKAVADIAHERGIALHLDGARLFNAAVALGVSAASLCADADSVNICFSKGLGAPVGSAIAGSREFVERCRRYRKMVGGGMRQAGVLAAAALIALREGPKRLHEDHANARAFAEALAADESFECEPSEVDSNIVLFRVRDQEPDAALAAWSACGVGVGAVGGGFFRAVTHLDVSHAQVLEAARLMTQAVHAMPRTRQSP